MYQIQFQQQAEEHRRQIAYQEQVRQQREQEILEQSARVRQVREQREREILERARQAQEQKEREHLARMKTFGDVLVLKADEFEELVASILRSDGYTNVIRTGGSGDLGADITAIDPTRRKTIVQCKRYSPEKRVGTPDLQKFIGMMVVHHKEQKDGSVFP